MNKDFKDWFYQKERIHNQKPRVYFYEREVWWCSLGTNIGNEQDGKGSNFLRPVLVFKKFNSQIFWALPVTTKIKNNRFHSSLVLNDGLPRMVILSQLKLIDAKRLQEKIGNIPSLNLDQIKKAINLLIG